MRADKSLSPFEIRVYRHYRIVHGTRVALAFLLTFLIIRLFTIPESTWPLVTMVVIMGPISFWGNVVPRAFERIGGTVLGSILGLIALQLELISLPLMLVWCAAAMFLCGWLALGKKPYQGLLIGVTLAIVVGSPTGEIDTALWRSGDVILGSLLAMLFTGIWPQRAFIHWRIQLAKSLTEIEHHVVGHVHGQRDGAHASTNQAATHPAGRVGVGVEALDDASVVTIATGNAMNRVVVINLNVDVHRSAGLVISRLRSLLVQRDGRIGVGGTGGVMVLAGNATVRQRVATVRGDVDLEQRLVAM